MIIHKLYNVRKRIHSNVKGPYLVQFQPVYPFTYALHRRNQVWGGGQVGLAHPRILPAPISPRLKTLTFLKTDKKDLQASEAWSTPAKDPCYAYDALVLWDVHRWAPAPSIGWCYLVRATLFISIIQCIASYV